MDEYIQVIENHWVQVEQLKAANLILTGDQLETVLEYVRQIVALVGQDERLVDILQRKSILHNHLLWCIRLDDGVGTISDHLSTIWTPIFELGPAVAFGECVLHPLLASLHLLRHSTHLPRLLFQVCETLGRDPSYTEALLVTTYGESELCLQVTRSTGVAPVPLLQPLSPWLHSASRDNQQYARDALLLFLAHCPAELQDCTKTHTIEVCEVLAMGLSGLYSSMPQKLEVTSQGGVELIPSAYQSQTSVVAFVDYLKFVDHVLDVCGSLIQTHLCRLVRTGFLSSVLGRVLVNSETATEETVTATCYAQLIMETTSNDRLQLAVTKFLLLDDCWGERVLESLVKHLMAGHSPLVLVTLSLFSTLFQLNSPDVVYTLTADAADTLVPPWPTAVHPSAAEQFLSLATRQNDLLSAHLSDQAVALRGAAEALPPLPAYPEMVQQTLDGFLQRSDDMASTEANKSVVDSELNGSGEENSVRRSLFEELDSLPDTEGDEPTDLSITELEDMLDEFLGQSRVEEVSRPQEVAPLKPAAIPTSCGFIQAILSLLDRMLENSLFVNVLLTKLISQICAVPFSPSTIVLLCPEATIQPNCRTLYQVLYGLRGKLASWHTATGDCRALAGKAEAFLLRSPPATQRSTSVLDKFRSKNKQLSPELRNCVYASLVFNDFCHEIAAIVLLYSSIY